MMETTLQTSNLLRSLTTYWRDTFLFPCPTIYPGLQQDASGWEAWVELTVPFFRERTNRETGLHQLELTVDVHCFAVRGEDLDKIRRIVDQVRQVLSGRVMVVRDFGSSALPTVGYVKFAEAEVRDLSRVERLQEGGSLSHFLVSLRGLAQVTEM